jgi:hypothetical protein
MMRPVAKEKQRFVTLGYNACSGGFWYKRPQIIFLEPFGLAAM